MTAAAAITATLLVSSERPGRSGPTRTPPAARRSPRLGAAIAGRERGVLAAAHSRADAARPPRSCRAAPALEQVGHQLGGALVGEEQPGAVELDHSVRAGQRLGQPMGPAHLEEDVAGSP